MEVALDMYDGKDVFIIGRGQSGKRKFIISKCRAPLVAPHLPLNLKGFLPG
jgi:hypothetical protein